jgi:hypothetical protein
MGLRAWFGFALACGVAGLGTAQGCSASGKASGNGSTTAGSGAGGDSACNQCVQNNWVGCDEQGNPLPQELCDPLVCVPSLGCRPCMPGSKVCQDNDIYECNDQGEIGDLVESCDPAQGLVCDDGECKPECQVADESPSNVGCEFWAVDLPNERGINDAAAAPWGVVLSNAGVATAEVTIERNTAMPGDAPQPMTVATLSIPSAQLEVIELPRAEVTGWTSSTADPPGPPMTWLSSNAFRIRSTAPLVVYQFNVFTNSFSNDASLLLPTNGLGTQYRILGYYTANPIAPIPFAGIPDRSSVTIVGVVPNTNVTFTAATTTVAGGSVPALQAGGTYTATIGPFDVLNVSSDGIPGDMTGSIVISNQPVAVFSSGERALAPVYTEPPEPPGFDASSVCCTDHIEEQLFPVTSMGKTFVITRSPVRSDGGYEEADELRFMGVAAPATVTTNLPPPFDSFTLQPGQMMETWTTKDVIVESTEPIAIGQMLLAAAYTTKYIGDSSLTIFPPIEQYRQNYLFLVPPSWTENHFVIATPKGATFELDGAAPAGCSEFDAGTLASVDYVAIRCPVGEGPHRLTGDQPFGLTVYGYGNVGSYAFAGGADVKPIYEPPPIK